MAKVLEALFPGDLDEQQRRLAGNERSRRLREDKAKQQRVAAPAMATPRTSSASSEMIPKAIPSAMTSAARERSAPSWRSSRNQ